MNVVFSQELTVRGKKRNVHLGSYNHDIDGWRAKINLPGKKTVVGVVKENVNGVKRFYPTGKNAGYL